MTRSIFSRYVLPFIQWFSLMIFIAIAADYFLHRMQIVSVGRYLGPIGTIVIIASFVYSLRKRKIIEYGSPKQLLIAHEYMAWGGSILILIHAGIHFNALLPWLAVLMLVIAVASGLVGKFLLKKSNETFREKIGALVSSGISKEEAEKKLFFDSITVDLMKKWRVVHLPITLLFGILALLHIITVIMFSK
ncbi:MAG: hypothetical protein IPP77_13390 [Bacteroidetes bacterium]|nr:hypothetical protein [Bacteroidota bacterium]